MIANLIRSQPRDLWQNSFYTRDGESALGRPVIRTSVSNNSRRHSSITPTVVFDAYWRFAIERLSVYYRRLEGAAAPWTTDPILAAYRFTNTYRAADRVSQYLIREIQYHEERQRTPEEVFFRTLLFKIFNKIETWEALEQAHGPLEWATIDLNALDRTLSKLQLGGSPIYSAAYIMPSPHFGASRKHTNHLKLIATMIEDRLPERIKQAPSLASIYETIMRYPGLGRFLSFQFTIDLNYSGLLEFSEEDFVVAGPGAVDGISKCFTSTGGLSSEALIHWVTDRQHQELSNRGLAFRGLFGRPLQPIDCQNLFCEISKYSRVMYPEISGLTSRRRIKQSFKRSKGPLPPPLFPPRWKITVPSLLAQPDQSQEKKQPVIP